MRLVFYSWSLIWSFHFFLWFIDANIKSIQVFTYLHDKLWSIDDPHWQSQDAGIRDLFPLFLFLFFCCWFGVFFLVFVYFFGFAFFVLVCFVSFCFALLCFGLFFLSRTKWKICLKKIAEKLFTQVFYSWSY